MRILAEVLVALLVGIAMAFLILEWMAGCGETYIAADGKRYYNECLFINFPKE